MHGGKKVWVENSPKPLTKLCLRSCLDNLDILDKHLQGDVYIPSNLAEDLMLLASDWENRALHLGLLEIFMDNPGKLTVKSLLLTNCPIPDKMLTLQANKLRRLELRNNNPVMGESVWNTIKHNQLVMDTFILDSRRESEFHATKYLNGTLPNLKHLSIRGDYSVDIIGLQLPSLVQLSAEGIKLRENFIEDYLHLISLTLHGEHINSKLLNSIQTLTNLQYLNIAFSFSDVLDNPGQSLREIVTNLPNLKRLDISGTSLVTRPDLPTDCDIDGLESRVKNPLEFLGVYFEEDSVYTNISLTNIPAYKVAASDNEERLLLAGETYLERCDVMVSVVRRLLTMARGNDVKDVRRTIELVIHAMEHHLWKNGQDEEALQILGAANLFYLVRNMSENAERESGDLNDPTEKQERGEKDDVVSLSSCNITVKKRIMKTILNSMEKHQSLTSLIRNGVLALWQFNIPDDPALLYREIIDRFLVIVSSLNGPDEEYVQRSTIILLNRLVCKAEGEEKKYKGGRIVLSMMEVIRRKLEEKLADEVMEVVWSVLWNITDETPAHSLVFLNNGGMNLFLSCKEAFPEQLDLLRNMMGLLGNVAEDKCCRKYLMNSDFIEEFSFLLDSQRDGIEVSYNAAGVISHLACDGPESWHIEEPERDFVLKRMCRAIKRWPVESDRNINYRSLVPILNLLDCHESPECQLWAAWAVANLSSYDIHKYAKMAIDEGGEDKIKNIKLVLDFFPEPLIEKMRELINIILGNTHTWRQQLGNLSFA